MVTTVVLVTVVVEPSSTVKTATLGAAWGMFPTKTLFVGASGSSGRTDCRLVQAVPGMEHCMVYGTFVLMDAGMHFSSTITGHGSQSASAYEKQPREHI